ncbi:FCD domain-containing protein [Nonomuraea mesophila]|uniref:FCD domain-containing protein n=1 Tax=Nonomuraea mesophila TaxID=2530382 RepID=A0A4R5F9N5_9ACTN|nr:FCD domain-containing protein [Nonomuraea mesophila]TDE44792.1 FCD domain-containing protein [Nonomuraea mesophila]
MTGREDDKRLAVGAEERATLEAWAEQAGSGLGLRSRIVLACADGLSRKEIAARLAVSSATVAKWRARFVERGLDGLADAPRPGRPRSTERQEAERLIAAAARGSAVPSTRSMARQLGLSQSTVARIWQEQQIAPPASQVLPRELLSDRVYALLRGWIVSGELVAGQRLVEAEIARRVGTSQAPAREAIKRLAHEGLVISYPNRGSYVAEISDEQAREVRDIRVLLEEYAARGAAARIQPETLQQLAGDVLAMRRAAGDGDIGAFRDADLAFHRRVCAACGNSFLLRLWRTIESNLWSLHVVGNPLYEGDWMAMAGHHDDLVAALSSGDPDEAARARTRARTAPRPHAQRAAERRAALAARSAAA